MASSINGAVTGSYQRPQSAASKPNNDNPDDNGDCPQTTLTWWLSTCPFVRQGQVIFAVGVGERFHDDK